MLIGDLCGMLGAQVRWIRIQKNMLRSVNCWMFPVDQLDKEKCSTSMSTKRALAACVLYS